MQKLGVAPGIVVYTCVIQTCIRAKQILTAVDKYDDMKRRKVLGDSVTFSTLLKGCVQFKKHEHALRILEDALANNVYIAKDVADAVIEGVLGSQTPDKDQRVLAVREQLKRNRFAKTGNQHGYRDRLDKHDNHGPAGTFWAAPLLFVVAPLTVELAPHKKWNHAGHKQDRRANYANSGGWNKGRWNQKDNTAKTWKEKKPASKRNHLKSFT